MRITLILIATLFCLPLRAAESAGGFGESVQGLSVSLLPRADGEAQPVIVLRNDNPVDLKLQGAFAWLLLAESRDVAFYSDQIPLDSAVQQLAKSGELRCPVPIGKLAARAYQKGIKVVGGYPQPLAGQGGDSGADRPLAELVSPSLKAQVIAYIPAGGQRIMVRSKAVALSSSRAAATQSIDTAALLERFRRDAFAARDAADLAAAKGPAVVPMLLEGLHDPAMPDFGQMWLAAALTRIGGEAAAEAAVSLVGDPREGIRDVIAFHGPSMKRQSVDDAIIRRAKSNQDPLFTAWAARGFAEHGRPVPPGLVLAALASSEPRARAEVAELLASSSDRDDAARLARLFFDENELVRVAAADAVGRHPRQPPGVLAAMVSALDRPGESARARIVAALAKCAGRDWQYQPDGPAGQNEAVLQQIRNWSGSRK